MTTAWPPPTATREEVAAFYAKHKPIAAEPEHEATPMSNAGELAANDERVVVLDGSGDADAVAERVWQAVSPCLSSRAGT